MTITGAIRKVEQARDKAGLTNDFHIYEKLECPKNENPNIKSNFKLTEYFSIDGLLNILKKVQSGEMAKDNDFINLFANMSALIKIIEHKNTNIFWYIEK